MLDGLLGLGRTIYETWARWISVILGVWLMAAPAVLGYAGTAEAAHRLIGPTVAGFAFVAVWPHMRALRWANVPLGAALLVLPWPFAFEPAATLNSLAVGLVLVTLAPIRGPLHERFGGGWTVLWRETTTSASASWGESRPDGESKRDRESDRDRGSDYGHD